MGIPGLINAIGAGERISLSKLAITHLERTSKPIRIAVDISIWLFQVQAGRGGKNPELRTLFYRLLKFLALPVHPLFVYDGKNKPPFKRGQAVSRRTYGNAPIIRHSKALIRLFKFPIHDAPGEAEAECAKLQKEGVVDAVMSNDVDALMFGSTTTIMNFSKESGSGSGAASHVTLYQMGDHASLPPNVDLDRAGMILFALLSGGDYLPAGVPKCGSKLAAEIARARFGQDLLDAVNSNSPQLDVMLGEWRERLQYELDENESGWFKTKHKAVRIPEHFPDPTLLSYYANPVVSGMEDLEDFKDRLVNAWDQDIDPREIRKYAAEYFDWNYRSGARKVIRLLAEPLVSYRLRLRKSPASFPLNPAFLSGSDVQMLQKIHKDRASFSTDGLAEFQLEIVPLDVVGLDLLAEEPNPPLPSQESTVSGDEEDDQEMVTEAVPPSPSKKRVTKRYDPFAVEKVWIFEALATIGIPDVVRRWKQEQAEKVSGQKKPTQRKTGPKKKGPIDPGMKRGSILKYGSLTKESSDRSEFKQARLFEAAVSGTPTKPSMSAARGLRGSPSGLMGNSPIHDVYNLRDSSRNQPHVSFDDLSDIFSSSCTISPGSGIKRPPVIHRPRAGARRTASSSGDIEVDELDVSSTELSLGYSPLPLLPGRIRMSYSNCDYQNSVVPNDVQITKDITLSSTVAKGRRQKTSKKAPLPPHAGEYQEVEELGTSMFSLSLVENLSAHETGPRLPEPSAPTARKQSAKKLARDHREGKEITKTQAKEKPATASKPDCDNPNPNPTKRSQHVESIIACDGFWTVETAEETTEPVSMEPEPDNSETKKSKSKNKKKRVPRVSILDLR